jgi:hypothetical protein
MFFIPGATHFFVWPRRPKGLSRMPSDNLISIGVTLLGKAPDDDNSLQLGKPCLAKRLMMIIHSLKPL